MSILSKGLGKIPPAGLGAGLGALGGLGMGMIPRMGGPMMGGMPQHGLVGGAGMPGIGGSPIMSGLGLMMGGAGMGGLLGHLLGGLGGKQGPTTPTPQIPSNMGRMLQGGAKANNVMPSNTIYDQGGMSSYETSPYPY